MSRAGKYPVKLSDGVTVAIADNALVVKGPKGELKLPLDTKNAGLVDIVIEEEPIVLQEVSVKSEKVWENNDTISYLADAFRDTTDIVIADVLKKMPGIEVKDDGKIEYIASGEVKGTLLNQFSIDEYKVYSEKFDKSIYEKIDLVNCLKARNV